MLVATCVAPASAPLGDIDLAHPCSPSARHTSPALDTLWRQVETDAVPRYRKRDINSLTYNRVEHAFRESLLWPTPYSHATCANMKRNEGGGVAPQAGGCLSLIEPLKPRLLNATENELKKVRVGWSGCPFEPSSLVEAQKRKRPNPTRYPPPTVLELAGDARLWAARDRRVLRCALHVPLRGGGTHQETRLVRARRSLGQRLDEREEWGAWGRGRGRKRRRGLAGRRRWQ